MGLWSGCWGKGPELREMWSLSLGLHGCPWKHLCSNRWGRTSEDSQEPVQTGYRSVSRRSLCREIELSVVHSWDLASLKSSLMSEQSPSHSVPVADSAAWGSGLMVRRAESRQLPPSMSFRASFSISGLYSVYV